MCSWISDERFLDPEDLDGEEWRDFTSYIGQNQIFNLRGVYQISSMGRIKNVQTNKIRKVWVDDAGYSMIDLLDLEDHRVTVLVHRAVLYTFVGNPPKDMIDPTCNHMNHDTQDNRVSNLEWLSRADNVREANSCMCKIVDKTGEHIFSGKGKASAYLGRSDFYITDCIQKGTLITSSKGEEVQVYVYKDGEWAQQLISSHDHRQSCKIEQNSEMHEFNSLRDGSRFLNKYDDYLSNMVRGQIKVSSEFKLYLYDKMTQNYKLFQPSVQPKRDGKYIGKQCKVTDSDGTHIFKSLSHADIYLGKQKGVYTYECLKYGRKARNSKNEAVELELI